MYTQVNSVPQNLAISRLVLTLAAFGVRTTRLSRQTVLLIVLTGEHFSGKIERQFVAQNVPHLTQGTVAQTCQRPR